MSTRVTLSSRCFLRPHVTSTSTTARGAPAASPLPENVELAGLHPELMRKGVRSWGARESGRGQEGVVFYFLFLFFIAAFNT
jgi:hypothetical protein